LCEYDALEGLGHAFGNHMQGQAIIGAARALKECAGELPYTVVVYGTPAEETAHGKLRLQENGCFQDIDVALMMHGSPTTTVDVKSLAMSSFTVIFHGRKAHAALKPEGRPQWPWTPCWWHSKGWSSCGSTSQRIPGCTTPLLSLLALPTWCLIPPLENSPCVPIPARLWTAWWSVSRRS